MILTSRQQASASSTFKLPASAILHPLIFSFSVKSKHIYHMTKFTVYCTCHKYYLHIPLPPMLYDERVMEYILKMLHNFHLCLINFPIFNFQYQTFQFGTSTTGFTHFHQKHTSFHFWKHSQISLLVIQ